VLLEDVADEVTVGHVGPMVTEYVEAGVPFLRSQNVEPLRINQAEIKYISPQFHARLKKSSLRPGDVVIVRTGKPGTCAVIPSTLPVANCSDLVIIRCGPELDPRYLSYYVTGAAQHDVNANVVGAVQQHFNVGAAKRLLMPLPPLAEQQRISGTLGALDDKIEQNRRMAETIERLVRADYSELVSSANGEFPSGWRRGSIRDLAENPRDVVAPGSVDGGTPYVGLEQMPRGRLVLDDWTTADKAGSGKSAFRAGDILFGKLRPYFRKVGVAPVRGICSTDILVLRPRTPADFGLLLGVATDPAFIGHANSASTGTRMPRASWADMTRFEIPVPPLNVRAEFTERVRPLVERAIVAVFENRTLAATRDALLPRLLSGELRVPEAERAAPRGHS
jgi:type I restriction enzyme S subunit